MQQTGNTILVTGGGSGIGRGLAEAFHKQGNQIIIAGRHQTALDTVTAANPGMRAATVDMGDPDSIVRFAKQLLTDFPKLNVVVHNAGMMRTESLIEGKLADAEETMATNVLGPMRLNAALLPFLAKQPGATVITVSSGLAFVPLALNPSYCASKAAIHSYTQSLRYQLKDQGVQVIELVPPYVRTGLTGDRQANDPMAMPLEDFVAETVGLLRSAPDAEEILVERVKPQRTAERSGNYDAFYKKFNDTMVAARTNE